MYRELFIAKEFEPFISGWGVWAIPTPYDDGFIMPLGWEEELTKRGIDFEVIELEEETQIDPNIEA